ncbi:hypothetical protein HYC85_022549 [Camellia sinensis]|uniref:Uncharacterized protein n=1 Tax=Camellia sinensis TaxID=4442 RepID=A0A7J7GKN8_CAMSI|nr:hypothetical protein HYC85_022549 [Camellia sinensis]
MHTYTSCNNTFPMNTLNRKRRENKGEGKGESIISTSNNQSIKILRAQQNEYKITVALPPHTLSKIFTISSIYT